MVKVDVYQHIRRQVWTSVPAFVIALAAFFVIGFVRGPDVHAPLSEQVELASLDQVYNITVWNLLPLVLLAVLSIRKVPASLALVAATLFAGVLGAFLQADVYRDFIRLVDPESAYHAVLGSIKAIWLAMANGFAVDTGYADIDRLLTRGGMDSMLLTLWLIFGAVTLGALLEEFGLIGRLVNPMIGAARTTGRLFLTVFACGFGLNVVAGDQYIALVLPSRIFRAEFARRGLAPTNLSRLAADSGTVTSPLVPWNSCGAFMGAVLGVSTLLYLPYAIFCWVSPLLSVAYGFTGFRIEHVPPSTDEDAPSSDPGAPGR
jgi:NhaC family Na+:H+ antiporter